MKKDELEHEYENLTLLQRIQKVKASVIYVQQDKSDLLKYWVNSYDKIMEKIRPLHIKYGICVVPQVVKSAQTEMIDRKSQAFGGYIAHLEVRYDVIAVPPVVQGDSFPVISSVVAASFSDLGGLATSKAFTHCHLKFLISFYEILTGSEDEDKKMAGLEAAPPSQPMQYISSAQAMELKRVGALFGVDPAVIAGSVSAESVDLIPLSAFDAIYARMKKRAQELGKWEEE